MDGTRNQRPSEIPTIPVPRTQADVDQETTTLLQRYRQESVRLAQLAETLLGRGVRLTPYPGTAPEGFRP